LACGEVQNPDGDEDKNNGERATKENQQFEAHRENATIFEFGCF
jgi:hypothetical protein